MVSFNYQLDMIWNHQKKSSLNEAFPRPGWYVGMSGELSWLLVKVRWPSLLWVAPFPRHSILTYKRMEKSSGAQTTEHSCIGSFSAFDHGHDLSSCLSLLLLWLTIMHHDLEFELQQSFCLVYFTTVKEIKLGQYLIFPKDLCKGRRRR